MKKRICAMLLCLVMVLGLLPAVSLAEEAAPPVLTAFTEDAITADGSIAELSWLMNGVIGDAGKFGAQWQKDRLWLAVDTNDAETLSVTLGGKTLTVALADMTVSGTLTPAEIAKTGDIVELSVLFEILGLTAPPVGTLLDAVIALDDETFTGALELSGVDWFAVTNEAHVLVAPTFGTRAMGSDAATAGQGFERTAEGYRLYNLYQQDANPAKIRTYVIYNSYEMYEELIDHDSPIYVEFDFRADALPVIDAAGAPTGNALFANSGISWVIAEDYDAGYNSDMVRMGIYNTENGLVFNTAQADGTFTATPLNRQVGDTFRLGISWELDGSLAVTVDGKAFLTKAGVQTNLRWQANRCVAFNLYNNTAAASAADSMDVSVTNIAMGKRVDPYLIPDAPTVVADGPSLTAYSAEAIAVDGSVADQGWLLNNVILDAEGQYKGKFGAQWQQEQLFLAVDTEGSSELFVEFGEKVLTVDPATLEVSGDVPVSAVAAADGIVELAVSFRALDLSEPGDGVTIPVVVHVDGAAFSGTLQLSQVDWFMTDNEAHRMSFRTVGTRALGSDAATANQGYAQTADGWRMYDLYSADGSNPAKVRTYVIGNTSEYIELADRSQAIYSEFEFCAKSMPVYVPSAVTNWNNGWACYGFSWNVADAYDSTDTSNFIALGILNTADGLQLAVMTATDGTLIFDLDREVGDKFRLGTLWETNGNLYIYLDGEEFRVVEGAQRRYRSVLNRGFAMNLIRSETPAAAEADSFDLSITNIALGKSADRTPPATSPASPALTETAFTAEAVTVDGSIADTGWLMSVNLLDENSVRQGKLGAQWTEETLYLAVDANGAETARLTVNGKTVTVSMADGAVSGDVDATAAVSGDVAEIALSLEALGVTVYDLDRRVPIKAVVGTGAYEGMLVLSGTDWFGTDNEAHRLNANTRGSAKLGTDAVTNKQGYQQTDDGWRLFDLYNPGGSNPAQIRTYVIMHGQDWLDPVCDRTLGTELSFDFTAKSMPVYSAGTDVGWSATYAAYGFSWILADAYDEGSYSNMISASIFNSTQGLMLAVLNNGDVPEVLPLGREVGDTFRITCRWMADRDLYFYLDGEFFAAVTNAQFNRRVTLNKGLAFNLIRNQTAAASEADDMDVRVDNIALGKFDNLSLLDTLTWDTIRGENETQDAVSSDLTLPAALSDSILTAGTPLTWSSSNPAVLAADGTVTVPETLGEKAVLTAELPTGAFKVFELIVPGTGTEAGPVLVKEYDYNPAVGAGEGKVAFRFTLDQNNSSVIRDLGETKPVSVVELRDGDGFARLAEDLLTLWVSDDNVTYTRIKDFKLLHSGNIWYLYDFAAEARYVKVHCTHYDGEEADFAGQLETMIDAYDDPLLGVNFTETAASVTNDGDTERYDAVYSMDGEAQRVLLNGELLYHYTENGKTYVRIPYLAAGETAQLTVLSGGQCVDLENKEYCYEVVYGTREARELSENGGAARWFQTLNDGTVVGIISTANGGKARVFSYDGGRTFVEQEEIEAVDGLISEGGGFIYDTVTGRLFYHGAVSNGFVAGDMSQSDCKIGIIVSEDGGRTWEALGQVQTDRTYALSYTQGLQLRCYDGKGPNVDFVFPAGAQFNDTGAFCCVVVYSDDGGDTWQTGESVISMLDATGHEGGVSEGTIMERDDGTLVLYVRNQSPTAERFAKSYSYDHGLTWLEHAQLTEVYTVNTQPIFYEYDGADLLTWGGNNVLGGQSYIRTPMNVAVTYDGGETFRNIQDLYVKYSFQGLTETTMHRITNQVVQKVEDDTLLLVWWNQTDNNSRKSNALMRVEDFTEYFYRTKGAYDSFEHGTVKFEGWDATNGKITLSDEQASDGRYAMKFNGGTAVRSIPYVQDGTVELKLHVSDGSHLSVNLQSAYSKVEAKCAPLGFSAEDYAITFFGAEEASGLKLTDGWNTVTFDLRLTEGTASVTVNGETAEVPADTAIGDYICYVTVMAGSVLYVDEFAVTDLHDAQPPKAEKFDLAGANMTLSNDLSLNFFVKQTDVTEGMYAEIVRNGKTTKVDFDEWMPNGNLYQISYNGFAAKEMTEEVTVTIYDANGNAVSNTWTDSIRSYAMRMIAKDDTEVALKTTLVDMLNYGAEAQVFFEYNTDDLANSLLTEEQKAFATASVEMKDIRVKADGYIGSSLELETNILLKFVFDDEYAGQTAVVTYVDHYGREHSDEYVLTKNGAYATIAVNTLVVADCSVPVTVTVGEITVIDSVESYCARMQLALCEPLMKFAASAKAYFK